MAHQPFKGSCITPFTVRSKTTKVSIPVPCGKCPNCLKRRVSAWSFRLMQEEKKSTSSWFVTLTFDTEHVPITRNGYMTLDKKEFQDFMKRLRKAQSELVQPLDPLDKDSITIKYYACGEYGGKTKRPHYHAIIFNVIKPSLIEKAWNKGAIHYGKVSGASVGYTLKYISKPKKIPTHRNDDRLQEFSLMSKGLGLAYLTEQAIKFHMDDPLERMCLTIEDGKKVAMPRYYKEKIYSKEQQRQIGLHQKKKMDYETYKEKLKYKGDYERDKVEFHIHKFKLQQQTAEKRDKL